MLRAFLDSLLPDRDLLLLELSKHITNDMLAEIALADYGRDQEQHLASLRVLRDTGRFSEPKYWYPCEVLELIRNSQPDEPSESPTTTRIRGHWMRAFACAALLRVKEAPWRYAGDAAFTSFTVIQLIHSLDALPTQFTPNAVRLVAWMMLHSDLDGEDEQVIFYGVGLLWLGLHLSTPPSDPDLIELAEWIVRREEEVHKNRSWAFDRWLLGIAHDPPPSYWEGLGAKLSKLDLSGHAQQLQIWVRLIGNELTGDSCD